MTTTLMEAKASEGGANESSVLAVLAAAGDAGVAPGEMAARTRLPERTWRGVVNRLSAKNLVRRDGQRGRIYATAAGRSEAGAGLSGTAMSGALGTATGLLPTEGHRAFLRLLLSNVIARHHLRTALPGNWGSFVALGPTKAGKTTMAKFVVEAFGLPGVTSIRLAPTMTPGAVWGRSSQSPGGWRFEPSPVLAQPFVCLDEVDKAKADTVSSIMRLVQGDTLVAGEHGEVAEITPTALLCSNAKPSAIKVEYRRRSVVLDLWQYGPLLDDVAGAVRRLLGTGVIPVLSLDSLAPPRSLAPALAEELRRALRDGLNTAGRQQVDELALERMALGRASLISDPRIAVLATAHDYLVCAATVGESDGVPRWLKGELGGSVLPMAPDVDAGESEVATPLRRAARDRQAELDFIRRRGELEEKLSSWLRGLDGRGVPEAHKAEARGLRDVIKRLRELAAKQVTLSGLAAITSDAIPEVRKAAELRARIDQERTAEERRIQGELDARLFAEEQEARRKQAAKAQRAAAASRLPAVRADIGVLEKFSRRQTTPTGKPADAALASLRLRDGQAVVYLEKGPERSDTMRILLGKRAPLVDAWIAAFDPNVRFPATPSRCPSLAQWGPNTRAVLLPALAAAYTEQDRLLAAAGRPPSTKQHLIAGRP